MEGKDYAATLDNFHPFPFMVDDDLVHWPFGVLSLAKCQYGCRCLQTKIDQGNPHEVNQILSEVMGHLHELMMHRYGNFLIQKIFQARNCVTLEQMDSIIFRIIFDGQKLAQVCMDNHGY